MADSHHFENKTPFIPFKILCKRRTKKYWNW